MLVSAASAWPNAIKEALGKLGVLSPAERAVEGSGFSNLPVDFRHATAMATLPLHHNDPFDRMRIAQARVEGSPWPHTTGTSSRIRCTFSGRERQGGMYPRGGNGAQ